MDKIECTLLFEELKGHGYLGTLLNACTSYSVCFWEYNHFLQIVVEHLYYNGYGTCSQLVYNGTPFIIITIILDGSVCGKINSITLAVPPITINQHHY